MMIQSQMIRLGDHPNQIRVDLMAHHQILYGELQRIGKQPIVLLHIFRRIAPMAADVHTLQASLAHATQPGGKAVADSDSFCSQI